jgi:hypothetical protein
MFPPRVAQVVLAPQMRMFVGRKPLGKKENTPWKQAGATSGK